MYIKCWCLIAKKCWKLIAIFCWKVLAVYKYIEQYNKNGILSLLFKGEIYSGGPHSTSYQVGRVYRLSTGKPIGLCELLNKDENTILDIFQQKWKEDKKKRGNDVYWDDFQPNYKKVEDIKFYLDSNGIHVFFDIYEAACYAEGVVEFLLFDFEKIVFK